jgi:hypothetical protein
VLTLYTFGASIPDCGQYNEYDINRGLTIGGNDLTGGLIMDTEEGIEAFR